MTESKINVDDEIKSILDEVEKKDGHQKEFIQAVTEVLHSLKPLFKDNPKYLTVVRTSIEPERAIQFRVPWIDDKGRQQVNRGFRVQFNSALGPYKGGLRFHPTVNLSVVKFLGFEQIFKNALTGLPMGGGKGGSDFNPKGKSDLEVLRFCQSFMTELYRHIGADIDVPAGDIGVGGREIGYLAGQYKRITANNTGGTLTGKGVEWSGSQARTEATGFGAVYIGKYFLEAKKDSYKDKSVLISGSGNVAQYTLKKLLANGAKVLSVSDSSGTIIEPNGITNEGADFILNLKNNKRGRIKEYTSFSKSAEYHEGKKPWGLTKADIVFPCATQNEIDKSDAEKLIANGVSLVVEGANMPTTADAMDLFLHKKIGFIPAKAANAGGVGVSGLEMAQNSQRYSWEFEEVDEKLQGIMKGILEKVTDAAERLGDPDNLVAGANAAGFIQVADAMIAQGQVFPGPH